MIEQTYLKNQKSENWFFIRFKTLHNFLYEKLKTTLIEGRGVCISLTRKNPNVLEIGEEIKDIMRVNKSSSFPN